MDFLRRLIGSRSDPKAPETAAPEISRPEPEITAPEAEVEVTRPEPTVQKATADTPTRPSTPAPLPPEPVMYGATRQLPPIESFVGKPGKHLTYGINSDVGMVRTNNQDSLFAMFSSQISADGLPDFGLFVVADGMGGHHDGERASATAARVIVGHLTQQFYLKILDNEIEGDKPIVAEVLTEAVQRANEIVSEEIPEGGTTVTAAAIVGDLVYVAHVGDSRAYLIVGDQLDQITRDHSLVQRLIELDQLTPDEAAAHPQRNVLYRAIGQSEHIEIDTATRRLPPGSRLLLCSDGLWNLVPEETIRQVVLASATPQQACDRLVALANDNGGTDNVTVVLVQVPG